MPASPGSTEAYGSCRFYVQIGGLAQAVFTELSGLQIDTKIDEYEEGGSNGFVYKLPGRTRVGNVTLKRGVTPGNELFNWYMEIVQGKIKRKNVSILMYTAKGDLLMHWDFQNAYPVKWSGPAFQADTNSAAIETLELAHDGLLLK